jgi:hypothetical protein
MAIPQPALAAPSMPSMPALDSWPVAVTKDHPPAIPTTQAPAAAPASAGAFLTAWRKASFPSKAIAILLAPALVGALFTVRGSLHRSGEPRGGDVEAASVATATAAVSPSVVQSSAAQPALLPRAERPVASAAPTVSGVVEAPKGGVAAVRDTRSAERRALDAAASGQDAMAAEQYEALAVAHPESAPFREAARILRERAAGRRDL